ncbi:alpha/beta fold hydrolase [Tumidithrix helvetica]|uniref:alpha/beta fold hydrolase n=1 Tax=Tumidithrix helvetica TaxID=3457545 RepID=UPI003CC69917
MKHIEGTLLGYEGCHLYYQSWQPEGLSQAIVVLVHGLGSHSGVFQNVVDYLVPQGYEVYALDLRGHGRSEGQRGYINRWQEFREDLHLLFQQIRSQRACCSYILWGHSLGGTIVLDYILHYPDNIRGAIVTAPALGKVNISTFKLSLGRVFSKILPRFSLKAGLHNEENARTPEAQLAYEQDPLRHEYGTARLATEFFATVDWIYNHASELKIPLLIMHGSADRVTLPEASRAFFQKAIFPDKEHREYPDGYHDLYVAENSRKVFTDLEIWLDRHLEGAQTCQFFLENTLQNAALVPLGHTLPSLLEEACQRYPNAKALNQWTENGWRSLSNQAFKSATESLAMGLLGLGLEKGDRVAFLMHNDLNFAIADMGCLLAGLVDVPIDLTQTLENIFFALSHSEAKALIVANLDLLKQIAPYLGKAPNLQQIAIAEVPVDWQPTRSAKASSWESLLNSDRSTPSDGLEFTETIPADACLDLHTFLHGTPTETRVETRDIPLPQCLQVFSLNELQAQGQRQTTANNLQILRSRLTSKDLATIIYIPAETGKLVGVMLTHENLSGNALAAFASLKGLEWGDREVSLSFLPLTHVFARCLFYGHLYYSHSVYLSHPNRVLKHLKEVQPTVLASVPLLLEKFYSKIAERNQKLSWWERRISTCALHLAQQYEMGQKPRGLSVLHTKLAMKIADGLVYSQWRSLFGDRLKYLLSGGAALSAEIANVFSAAGIPILQGYGLTQTGGVACFNRLDNNRAGTVGSPIPGVEIAIATDGEILVRGLYVTPGYYKNAEATLAAIDAQGWLHTGDLGAFTANGLLKITGMKKALFKLSTGKYIAPQPLEAHLRASTLVKQAAIVGSDRKFCSALIFANLSALRDRLRTLGFPELSVTLTNDELFRHPCILSLYRAEIDAINCHLPYWANVKRFLLSDAELTVENGLLTESQQIDRAAVTKHFSREIDALYGEGNASDRKDKKKAKNLETEDAQLDCADYAAIACPIFTQSLNPRFTT